MIRQRIANILRRHRPAHLRNYRRSTGVPQGTPLTPQQRLEFLNQRVAQWQTNHPGQAIPQGFQNIIDKVTARINGQPPAVPGQPPAAPATELAQQGPPANAPAWGYRRNNNMPFIEGREVPNGIMENEPNIGVNNPNLELNQLDPNPNMPQGYNGASLLPFRNKGKMKGQSNGNY